MANVKSGGIIKNENKALTGIQLKKHTMQMLLKSMEKQIKAALPSVLTPERFTRMVFTAMSTTPKLLECSQESFIGAVMQSAQLGLEPNTPLGQAWLLPYKNHGHLECQFQLGYKGLIDLAYRSGEVTIVDAHEVCENDLFNYEFGLNAQCSHKPALVDRGKVIAYYGMFKTKLGGFGFQVMSMEEVQAFAKKESQSYGSSFSPWHTYFDEMAKKTVLKRALKYAPMKTEFMRQITADETVKSTIGKDMLDMENEADGAIDVKAETVEQDAKAPGTEQVTDANGETWDMPAEQVKEVKQQTLV